MDDIPHILILTDGKPGHENQSRGLAEAMARLRTAEIDILRLDLSTSLMPKIRKAINDSREFPKPDYVIAAGHGTHFPLMRVARTHKAKSIVLMKPGIPMSWFTWCVAPEHDFRKKPSGENVILSKGAPNRIVPVEGVREGKLILIGGPSRTHGFDENSLMAVVKPLISEGGWSIADSRRTPATFLSRLRRELPDLEIISHTDCGPDWLAERLARAGEVRVTEDSVSMIYEALTGGANVGVLEMPRLRPDARVVRGLDKLKNAGWLDADQSGDREPLAEADRCAGIILGRA